MTKLMEKIQDRKEQMLETIKGKPVSDAISSLVEEMARTQVVVETAFEGLTGGLARTFEDVSESLKVGK